MIEVFHLPPVIYSRVDRPCNVAEELADFPLFNRNYATQVALVNGQVQYEHADGALLCALDDRAYDFLHQLYLIDVQSRGPSPWSL